MNLVGKKTYNNYEIRLFMDEIYSYIFKIYKKGKPVNKVDYVTRYIPGDKTQLEILYNLVKSDIDNNINIS